MAEINVVPYIDVMLVLLVIFMITAPMLSPGVAVTLPTANTKQLNPKAQEPIVVSIDANGSYYINISQHPDTAIAPDDLLQQVSTAVKAEPNTQQRPVLVKGDKNVDYGKVIAAMVLLQKAGVEDVGLITQPEK